MTFIELYILKGTLSEEQYRSLSEQFVPALMSGTDGLPAEVRERGNALIWTVVHVVDAWTIGRQWVDPAQAPPYFVRVSVPGGHLNQRMRAEIIGRITHMLAEIDLDPRRLYQTPSAWIHIIEVPDGNIGGYGQIMRMADLAKSIMDPDYEASMSTASTTADEAADTVLDPICGMTVELTEDAITLVYDGETYGFCSPVCRDLFAERMNILPAVQEEQ